MFLNLFILFSALLEGKPQKNSYCSNKISGDAITWLPKLQARLNSYFPARLRLHIQGTLSTPPRSPLLWPHLGPLKCSTQLQSGGQQSVLLTVRKSFVPLKYYNFIVTFLILFDIWSFISLAILSILFPYYT